MAFSESAGRLDEYLAQMGILSCNDNPYLPSLNDIGCAWQDVTSLIDAHRVFYSKAYRHRTVYLSPEVYYLLRTCRAPWQPEPDEEALYAILHELGPVSKDALKPLARMDLKRFQKAFVRLLEHCRATALRNGTVLTENWSAFLYSTEKEWEKAAGPQPVPSGRREAFSRLQSLLLRSMPEKELHLFFRQNNLL